MSSRCNFSPNEYYPAVCFITGWFGARWYRALSIDPPKIHPGVAVIHGLASNVLSQAAYCLLDKYLLDEPSDQETYKQKLKTATIRIVTWVFSVVVTLQLVNYLNMNYLKATQINQKTIPLTPITLRDAFLMEGAATGLCLGYSLVCHIHNNFERYTALFLQTIGIPLPPGLRHFSESS